MQNLISITVTSTDPSTPLVAGRDARFTVSMLCANADYFYVWLSASDILAASFDPHDTAASWTYLGGANICFDQNTFTYKKGPVSLDFTVTLPQLAGGALQGTFAVIGTFG